MAHLEMLKGNTSEEKAILSEIQSVRGTPFSEIWETMLHHPGLTKAVSGMGKILRFQGSLPGNIREAVILYIAGATRSSYEWAAHIEMAIKEGVQEEILSFLKKHRPFADFPEPYCDAIEAAQMCLEKRSLPSSLQDRLIAQYDKKGVVELVLLAGFYQMIAAFLGAFDIEPAE